MDDYIKRGDAFDAVMGQFCACSDETEAALNGAIEDIRKKPAADVRPVVLCKDCVHFQQFRPDCGLCKIDGMLWSNDFFCANGKREES